MKRWNQLLAMAAAAVAFYLNSGQVMAQQERQGRGNFDPEQARQRMMERYKEQLEVKDDAEWKIIQERIEKVTTARREVGTAGFGGFGGRRGAGAAAGGGENAGEGGNRRPGGGGGGGGFGRFEASPEADALQKSIEAKASNDEIKQKLAKLREARKDKEAKLEKAQDELRQVLSVRQEANAVLLGLLK